MLLHELPNELIFNIAQYCDTISLLNLYISLFDDIDKSLIKQDFIKIIQSKVLIDEIIKFGNIHILEEVYKLKQTYFQKSILN